MTRRESFMAALGLAPIERPERKNSRARHTHDKLYHGPLRIPAEVAERSSQAPAYKTTHGHPVLRIEDKDGVVYLWRCLPVGEGDYLGEVVRTPEGAYRVHLYRAITLEWRGKPKTPASIIARYVPDPTIPAITEEQERAHFLGAPIISEDGRLLPPLPAAAKPSWQE